jgi:putative transposase
MLVRPALSRKVTGLWPSGLQTDARPDMSWLDERAGSLRTRPRHHSRVQADDDDHFRAVCGQEGNQVAEGKTRKLLSTMSVRLDLRSNMISICSSGTAFASGRKITSPRFLRRAEKKLKHAQRILSRKQKGSKNRDKARIRFARAHARAADTRREFHHQLSTALIRENQAIAVEDLAVKALARTRMARSVHDAAWSAFVHMLEYKAQLYGRRFYRIGRFEPTSQMCSTCGARDGPKPLHIRTWRCGECGAWLDRDVNAAVNVARAAGLAVTACGAQVRPGFAPVRCGEAGTHRGAA